MITISATHSARQPIGMSASFFIDSSGSLTVAEIQQLYAVRKFSQAYSKVPNFGNTKGTVWLAFMYINQGSIPSLLEIDNTQLQNIHMYYIEKSGNYSVGKSLQEKGVQMNKWVFELSFSAVPQLCLIRLQSNRVITVPAYITTYASLLDRNHKADFWYGIYFGLMTIMILYNLLLYLIFRGQSYIWYIGHIVLQISINSLLKGYFFEWFPEETFYVNRYLPAIAMSSYLFMILFARSFMDTGKNLPALHKGLKALSGLILLGIILNVLAFLPWLSYLGIVVGLITASYLLVVAIIASMQRIKGALFYCLGWGIFLIGLIILDLSLLGWIPGTIYTDNGTLAGGVIEGVFISMALSDKINQLRKERINAQAEKLSYITRQNAVLEEKVVERTQELVAANATMEVQYKELHQQKEELKAANETLMDQKEMIEMQTRTLIEMNRGLEITVQERTFELKKSIEDLLQQNQDLQQFSYILSHNLRSPIARIRGLVAIFNKEDMSDPMNGQLLEYLNDSAENLDTIIHDLSHIITIRKNLNTIKEDINLKELFETIILGLTTEIEQANAKIVADFSGQESVYSVRSYLHSILYNLISNAIKYRATNRLPLIQVKTVREGAYTCLTVQDNGLGIDLNAVSVQQIFGFYKRVHSHVDGKGLGLYLVKTQVESLQGKVELESEPNVGSIFRIYF